MCESSSILVFMLILKIVIIFIVPIILYIFRDRLYTKYFLYAELLIVFILIINEITLANNCFYNSTIGSIIRYSNKDDIIETNFIYDKDEEVISVTPDTYENNKKDNIYYFSNNTYPLKNVKNYCNNEYLYNYGDAITSYSMLVSSISKQIHDPIKIINHMQEQYINDCSYMTNIDSIIEEYSIVTGYVKVELDSLGFVNTINNDGVVLVEVKPLGENDFSCTNSYILVYQVNGEGLYSVLNPNDKTNDYICNSNTLGYGGIIKANQNNKLYSFDDINSRAIRYITLKEGTYEE